MNWLLITKHSNSTIINKSQALDTKTWSLELRSKNKNDRIQTWADKAHMISSHARNHFGKSTSYQKDIFYSWKSEWI